MKNKFILYRILAGIFLLAAIAGIAWFAYQVGVNSTEAASALLPAVQNGMPLYPYYFMHPFLGFLGLLLVLFMVGLAFKSMRFMIWGPRWYGRRMGIGPSAKHHMGHHHRHWNDEGVPPMVEEWHKRMHAEPAENQKD
jgi:TRAP-type C4-dicarboxylate transport system permease small subunit